MFKVFILKRGRILDLQHDLAKIAKQDLINAGMTIPTDWDDYAICINYLEIHQRWFDSSIPYRVVYSKELLKKLTSLTQEEKLALQDIEKCLNKCKPLTLYMSKGIRETNIKKSDFLLKNWNIYHLHLEKLTPSKNYYTKPNLLFFQPKGNVVHFIDIRPHPKGSEWFNRDLLEIIYSNWPWLLTFLKEVKPLQSIPDDQIHSITKNMNIIIDFHGGALSPSNLGVASSGNSIKAVMETNRIFNALKKNEDYLRENEDVIKQELENDIGITVDNSLDYELIVEDNYFVAYEKTYHVKIKLFEV